MDSQKRAPMPLIRSWVQAAQTSASATGCLSRVSTTPQNSPGGESTRRHSSRLGSRGQVQPEPPGFPGQKNLRAISDLESEPPLLICCCGALQDRIVGRSGAVHGIRVTFDACSTNRLALHVNHAPGANYGVPFSAGARGKP